MTSKSLPLESEVASYILAYLLQNNLKASANAFLQECDVLPSKNFIVLPETPLQNVIAEHKARVNARVLVNTLGCEQAWQELWSKLNTTLDQIRSLSEDLNKRHFQPTPKIKIQKNVNGESLKKSSESSSEAMKIMSVSPNKRKQGSCRRIQYSSPTSSVTNCPPTSDTPGTPNSPTVQQVLDTFIDDTFPGKLANIINQCVSSDTFADEVSSDMSSETIERILNATMSESLLEGVFPSASSVSLVHASGPTVTQPAHFLCSSATTSTTATSSQLHFNTDLNSPTIKRPKLDSSSGQFPSEQDIDSFLDQIHQ